MKSLLNKIGSILANLFIYILLFPAAILVWIIGISEIKRRKAKEEKLKDF